MNKYKQLTLGQRYEIEVLLGQGKNQKAIAEAIDVDKSTVYREIERNSAGGKYRAEEAQRRYTYKQGQRSAYKLKSSVPPQIPHTFLKKSQFQASVPKGTGKRSVTGGVQPHTQILPLFETSKRFL